MKRFFLITLSALLLLTGCHKKEKVAAPKLTKEQSAKIKDVNVTVKRYEKDLFSLDVNHLADGVAKLYGKYPENFVAKDCWKNEQMMAGLKGYITDPTIKKLYKDTEAKYADLSDIKKELDEAFKIYLAHFPNDSVPTVVTYVSGMNFEWPSVFTYDNNLIIALDMYLGKDYKNYAAAGMPKFVSERCERRFIATDCFSRAMAYKHLPEKTLISGLDNMIYEGKKLFLTQTVFPNKKEQEIIGYSDAKYEWTQKYQSQVWQYFVEKNMLYSKDEDVIRRLVDETPFTRDFGNNSPGRLGAYIGWQIVKSYMKNHPETTMEEFFKMTDSQKILNDSYYKP